MVSMAKPLFLSEELIFTTVRIETTDPAGRVGCGTGFFFQFAKTSTQFVPAIVSNRHVFAGADSAVFHLSLKAKDGSPVIGTFGTVAVDGLAKGVVYHPDPSVDLAILPCGDLLSILKAQGRDPFLKGFALADIPSPAELDDLSAVEPVLMVGYPIGLWDSVNNRPIVRRGTTATHPAVNFNGQPQFLIDCACWPGSSGSPVVLYHDFASADRQGNINLAGPKMKLLGVLFAGPVFDAAGKLHAEQIPTSADPAVSLRVPVNLGFVLRAGLLHAFDPIALERSRQPDGA